MKWTSSSKEWIFDQRVAALPAPAPPPSADRRRHSRAPPVRGNWLATRPAIYANNSALLTQLARNHHIHHLHNRNGDTILNKILLKAIH
ncbi:hypothetical protein EVAR_30700_1 [Eumeta japonica]|uniref:Uncharacterized protein n=1 Tax=Eumeta variegata TaxID=151549 RepID=A0A4C1V690_EUMVA|nr:hypothetical protein EVAR_30700_1 [Eumeta japonica]